MAQPHRPTQGATRAQLRSLIWIIVIFDLMVILLAAWTLLYSRRQTVERAEMTTQNLALVLEQSLLAHVHQIDLVLRSIKDEAERTDLTPSRQGIETHVQAQLTRVPLLESLLTTDAAGALETFGTSSTAPELKFAEKPFFQHLKASPQPDLFISRPTKDGSGGTWVITLARRLDRPAGVFRGAVLATVRLDKLTRELAQVDVGQHGSLSLRGKDLELLARYPRHPGQEQGIGDTHISGDYLVAIRSNQQISHFTTPSVLDRQTRTYTLRKVADPGFYIQVGLAQQEYLQSWRREAWLSSLAVAGLMTLSIGIGRMAWAAWLRQLEVQSYIEQQESKFRLLAENALDVVWTVDSEGCLTYLSPSVMAQRGYAPEELVGTPLQDRIIVDQRPLAVDQLLTRVMSAPSGSQPFEAEHFELDLARKDGSVFRGEIRLRLLWKEDGSLLGLLGVTRDITERTRLEAEQDRLIQELYLALAEVKSLKGMLPICGHCKKIRDDQGYWNHLEAYISEHTDATFTHGMCPDCTKSFREEMQRRKQQEDP